jgi:hypothetical protein
MDPLPRDIVAPVCPLQLSRVAKEASTHHLITLRLSALRMSGRCIVHLMYLSSRLSFDQSSSSGFLTLVVRKATPDCMSFLALADANNSCATQWWNAIARFSSSGLHFLPVGP